MSALSVLLASQTDLDDDGVAHLQRLVGQWQLLADLSFADLLLWVPVGGGDDPGSEFLCVAQCRPTTGPTAHLVDDVGQVRQGSRAGAMRIAHDEARIFRESDPEWTDDVPVRHEAIPVRFGATDGPDGNDGPDGKVIAVLGRDANLTSVRSPSQLELAYLQSAADLAAMVADGTFPGPGTAGSDAVIPRAGDGLLRLDPAGVVLYASPNALSAFRRLGAGADVVGVGFGELVRSLLPDTFAADDLARLVEAAVEGRHPPGQEVDAGGTTVLFRPLPLTPRGQHLGALVLLQDVTELRQRDRQIMSKDATIREIHHRVKNNLQTVAALLRLQSRRVAAPEARTALSDAMRRVSAIALVHETLAVTDEDAVVFDEVIDQILPTLADVTGAGDRVSLSRNGSFGELPAQIATPLVLVLAELVQNAVEHGFGEDGTGTVEVGVVRERAELSITVSDDGVGLPPGFDPARADRLGLQIVRTLADAELHAQVTWRDRHAGESGTTAALRLDLAQLVDLAQRSDL